MSRYQKKGPAFGCGRCGHRRAVNWTRSGKPGAKRIAIAIRFFLNEPT